MVSCTKTWPVFAQLNSFYKTRVSYHSRVQRFTNSFHEYVKLEMQVTMNVKCGCLDSARGIFDTMGVRDVFSWTRMVNGYAKSGELELARMSFNEMPERNVVSWSAMIAG